MAKLRRSFNTDFKREAANLVLKEGYLVAEAPLFGYWGNGAMEMDRSARGIPAT